MQFLKYKTQNKDIQKITIISVKVEVIIIVTLKRTHVSCLFL